MIHLIITILVVLFALSIICSILKGIGTDNTRAPSMTPEERLESELMNPEFNAEQYNRMHGSGANYYDDMDFEERMEEY